MVRGGRRVSTVVILEDDESSRCFVESVLEREFRVIATDSPENAIRLCDSEQPDLFVSDNLLKAALSGLQTVCLIHESHPQLPVLVISGMPPEGWPDLDFGCFEKLVNSARLSFLQKPFKSEAIRKQVADLISGNWSSSEIQMVCASAANHRGSAESWRVRFPSPRTQA
jgi:DNA-binding NtrC family response regulator